MSFEMVEQFASLQPNNYSCGPTALRNALLLHNKLHSITYLSNASGCTEAKGADEHQLEAAARECGFKFAHHMFYTAALTQETVRYYLRKRIPVLLCVDRDHTGPYVHWICVVKATARHVWVCDSARPGPVLRRYTWRQFLVRAAILESVDTSRFDIYAVIKEDA